MRKKTIRKNNKEIVLTYYGDGEVRVEFGKGFTCPIYGEVKGGCYNCSHYILFEGCGGGYQIIKEDEVDEFINKYLK